MDFVTLCLALAIIAALTYYIYKRGLPEPGSPPGPWRPPLIGNSLEVGGMGAEKRIFKLHEKYGPIFQCQFGPFRMVIISDPVDIKAAFSSAACAGKPDHEMVSLMSAGKYGILNNDGEAWQEQRRFCIRHLRDLGFGKTHMEDLVMEEVNEFIAWLLTEEGMPVEMSKRFSMAVLNSIWVLLDGRRYKHDDPKLQELFQMNHEASTLAQKGNFLFLIPPLAKALSGLSGYAILMDFVQSFRNFFTESISEHESMLSDDETTPRDLVEGFLMEMRKQKDVPGSTFNDENGRKNLLALVSDLFVAGHETTSATLQWLVLYVTLEPRIQAKIHEELDRVVGKSRRPALADRSSLIYVEAVILETLRLSSIAPMGVPHIVTEDTELRGYKIPKGVWIASSLWTAHHDPAYWERPDEFYPERFISPDGKCIVKSDNLIPFSVGKRACLGELMARTELFLFAANIFHRFHVQFDPASPTPTTEHGETFILAPLPYKVIMRDRLK